MISEHYGTGKRQTPLFPASRVVQAKLVRMNDALLPGIDELPSLATGIIRIKNRCDSPQMDEGFYDGRRDGNTGVAFAA